MEWLNSQDAVEETELVRHLRFEKPLVTLMDGKHSRGIVMFPDKSLSNVP
jgi:hypothetical protein